MGGGGGGEIKQVFLDYEKDQISLWKDKNGGACQYTRKIKHGNLSTQRVQE